MVTSWPGSTLIRASWPRSALTDGWHPSRNARSKRWGLTRAAVRAIPRLRTGKRSSVGLALFVTPPNEPDPNKFLDVWFIGDGGCERSEAEYRALPRRGGFTLARVVPTGGSSAI